MEKKTIKILLIDSDCAYGTVLSKMLGEVLDRTFKITYTGGLSTAMTYLENQYFDIVLLDLILPDRQGFDVFQDIHAHFSEIPVIILTDHADDKVAVDTVKNGAQDYLLKDELDGKLLARSIRYAIERHRMQMNLHTLSFLDDLTGLYNRRGLNVFGNQSLKMSLRKQKKLLVTFVDVDGLKKINDTYGHSAGDQLLIDTANILRKTFRETDIKARKSGDEFTVVALEFSGRTYRVITSRLEKNIKEYNINRENNLRLSLSYGMSENDPAEPLSFEELLLAADKKMYEHKKLKKTQPFLFEI